MGCNTCFEDILAKCPESIRVFAQLPSLPLYDSYRWIITDKFDRKYEGSFIVDGDGFWSIPVDELPDGLLTEYSGSFKLEVLDGDCKPIKFKIAKEYDCISFEVKAGTFVKDNLGCEFTCVGAPAGQSAFLPFTNQATVSITWAPYLSLYGNHPNVQVWHETTPGNFQLVSVAIETIYVGGVLQSIEVDNGGVHSGYIVIS